MELWIRSQNKEVLLNLKAIQYKNYKLVEDETVEANILIGFYNYYDNEILAEYKTKERALEVLDEIQNIIHPKYILNSVNTKSIGNTYYTKNGIIYKNDSNEGSIHEISTLVYEMPEN